MKRVASFVQLMAVVVVASAVASLALPALGRFADGLHFNGYAIPSLVALLTNVILLVVINRLKHKTPETFWFSLFVVEIAFWGLCELLQRLSVSPQSAMVWYEISAGAWILLGVTFFMYTVVMTKTEVSLKRFTSQLALVVGPLVFLFMAWNTDLLVNYIPAAAQSNPWGYYWPYGKYFSVFLIWLELYFVCSLVLLVKHYRATKSLEAKRQAMFNIVGLLVPLLAGTVTDGILPILEVKALPVAVLFTTVQAVIIGYAITRYRIFSFNPATLATNILAGMNEVVLILNQSFKVEYVNQRAVSLLGYPEADLIGSDAGRLFGDADRAASFERQLLEPLRANSKFESKKSQVVTAEQKRLPVIISAAQIANEGDNQSNYVLVITDISQVEKVEHENKLLEEAKEAMLNALEDAQELEEELKREKAGVEHRVIERTRELSEEKARLNASINSLQVGFVLTNHRGKFIMINATAYSMFGGSLNKFNFEEIWNKIRLKLDLQSKIQSCLADKRVVDIKEISYGDKFLRVSISPVVESRRGAIGTVILIEDVTEEKVLARSKDEFFSIASHELRTPLTAIRGNTAMIQQYYAELLKDQNLKELITDIHESAVRLIAIVNDFLDVSRLEQGKMEFKVEEFNIDKVIESVVYEMAQVTKVKGIYIKTDSTLDRLPLVKADKDRVKQVVYNLVGNAMKFTDKGGIIISAEAEDGDLKVLIEDTGRGIPVDKQSLLFHKFQQAGGSLLTRDTTRGTGLGLYISKLLVESMGGAVRLERSKVGQGTTFSFTLPLAARAASTKATKGVADA